MKYEYRHLNRRSESRHEAARRHVGEEQERRR